jgi:hypothetical protein
MKKKILGIIIILGNIGICFLFLASGGRLALVFMFTQVCINVAAGTIARKQKETVIATAFYCGAIVPIAVAALLLAYQMAVE